MPIDCLKEIKQAKKDASLRSKPMSYIWSGQDVLIDFDPSYAKAACMSISEVRVWPKKVYGFLKSTQIWSKIIIKTDLFNNFLLLSVILNTIALALDQYGLPADQNAKLTTASMVFTFIFIGELGLKLFGLGPRKYMLDRMNLLDGLVVCISIAELIIV